MHVMIEKIVMCMNIAVIAGMLVTGFSGHIDPAEHPLLSTIGFAFPAFLIADIAFVLFWVVFRWRRVWVPVVGLLLAYSPTMYFCPINRAKDIPAGSIKVISYNVLNFNEGDVIPGEPNPILQYLVDAKADIVCMQEFSRIGGQDSLWNEVDKMYPYNDTLRIGWSTCIALYSRFPIKSKQNLNIKSEGNMAGVFTLTMDDGSEVRVINAHLETVGLSAEQRNEFREMVHGDKNRHEIRRESKALVTRIGESSAIRAPQARTINEYIEQHEGENIIFCGDLNDHPLSYVHHTIARRLKDCYREAGRWTGYSFHYNSMYVRIDNIMCSDNWEVYECHVDRSIDLSDHYPICCFLKK